MTRRLHPADAHLDVFVQGAPDALAPDAPGLLTVAGPGGTATTYTTVQADLLDALGADFTPPPTDPHTIRCTR